MPIINLFIIFLVGLVAGYVCFLFVLRILPNRLAAGRLAQKGEILLEAQKHAASVRAESNAANEAKIQILREELDASITQRLEDLKLAEADLDSTEKQITPITSQLQKQEHELNTLNQHVEFAKSAYEETSNKVQMLRLQVLEELEVKSKADSAHILKSLTDQLAEQRRLESQRLLKLQTEELSNSARRVASRFLSRSMSRYAPEFPWPKMINSIEIEDRRLWDLLATDSNGLLVKAKELASIDAEFLPPRHEGMPGIVKLSGGMGIDREAARLALTDVVRLGTNSWNKLTDHYSKQRSSLEHQALKLGRQAVNELQIEGLHLEIVKLVGYLNWRTSYRQNQYLHSFEVAMLAGLVADELGVDPVLAKRCGLLHDIGKVLDYRIEGSHAVISGDYADRYGENRLICDTVMSHHNDLVVETPLAYVLKTADTLSGARPGARVNLEEGYQDRLSAIDDVVRGFQGITKSAIMNGGREIHIEVNHKRVREEELSELTSAIAKKIESDVAFPGQIKVMVTRRFESSSVA